MRRSRMGEPAARLIVALDSTNLSGALRIARRLRGAVQTVKVGSVLFTRCGPEVVRRMRALGFGVMLDLKFLDIPQTVELSCRAAAGLGVSWVTVHASGGPAMLRAAVRGAHAEAAQRGLAPPGILGVTVLTSIAASSDRALAARVHTLARAARRAGCAGVVASAHEAAALRRLFGRRLTIMCPGIRPAFADAADQQRVSTPAEAIARGADFLVVGRPITGAQDPRAAATAILEEMEAGSTC